MGVMKRIVTNIRINHVARDTEGRATHYRGVVLHGKREVLQTEVMTDGCECLRAAEKLERQYRSAAR